VGADELFRRRASGSQCHQNPACGQPRPGADHVLIGGGFNKNPDDVRRSSVCNCPLTADEGIVETALAGQTYRLGSFSKTINLATTSAGGMDTGAAPVNGFVAIYAIYNPVALTSALQAVNATSTAAPSICGGANMPAGYTASALVSVWATDASSLLKIGYKIDRFIWIAGIMVLNTTTANGTLTALSIAVAVPLNAISVKIRTSIAAVTSGATVTTSIAGSTAQIGISTSSNIAPSGGAGITAEMGVISIITTQTTYYTGAVSSGSIAGFNIIISGYGI
jgi:hypothetical protein